MILKYIHYEIKNVTRTTMAMLDYGTQKYKSFNWSVSSFQWKPIKHYLDTFQIRLKFLEISDWNLIYGIFIFKWMQLQEYLRMHMTMTLISPRSRILLIAWHNAIIPISDIPISDNALKGFKWNRTDDTISQIWLQIEWRQYQFSLNEVCMRTILYYDITWAHLTHWPLEVCLLS